MKNDIKIIFIGTLIGSFVGISVFILCRYLFSFSEYYIGFCTGYTTGLASIIVASFLNKNTQ